MVPKEPEERRDIALRLSSFEYAVLPANAPEVIVANTIYVRAPEKIEPVVDSERRRGFQSLVRRYMNQLLYGCQRPHCDTATCYTFRKTLSRNTNASRKLTVLSARIIACHLATQDEPFKALCPGKPVVPVMSSEGGEPKAGMSRDSSFKEEIADDDEAEKENKEVATAATELKEKKRHREGEVETVTDKGLKDPKSFPQQLFNTMSLKMVEWIGLPPLTGALKFSPECSSPAASSSSKHSDSNGALANSEMDSTPPYEQPPKYKFHSNPMELMDTGRLHRDSEPVSQHKHQEILQQPPAHKRRTSNPTAKTLKDVVTPTPHSNATKAKMSTPGVWGMPPPAPPPIGGHHNHHKPRPFIPQAPQITPSRGDKNTQISSQTAINEACVMPPQSLAKLDADICEALIKMCLGDPTTTANKRDTTVFAKQSLFYIFSTPEALLKSFVSRETNSQEMDLDMESTDISLKALMVKQEWENMIIRSMWVGLETVFSRPGEGFMDREVARLILLALHVLAATLPRSTPEQWEATRKLRGSGRVSESGAVSEIGFENEMAERLMRRVVRAIAYRSTCGDGVVGWLKVYFSKCGKVQEEQRRRMTVQELGEELAKGVDRGKGGWGLGVCTLEWCRAVLLKFWDGQEAVKRGGVVASCLGLLKILHEDHRFYGLEPEYFHTPVLADRYDFKEVPVEWFNANPDPKTVHFLDYPFIFPPHALVTYFRAVNLSHMSKAYEQSMTMARLTHQMSVNTSLLNPSNEILLRRMRIALSTYLLVEVNRETVLEDALDQIFRRELRELQRPLKVRFANNGEEGVDHGGVQQEFFIIALREALRPEYGMFTTDEKSRMSWFSVCPVEPVHKFELLGLLVGLAVYNGVTLPVTFPRVLYQKLLGMEPDGLDDIKDGWSSLASGLTELLKWDQGDVGDVFLRTYEFSYESFGKVKNINMLKAKQDGLEFLEEKIVKPPVKKEKKKEEKRPEPEAVEDLLDLQNWLPVPASDERDPWLGELNEVLEVLDRGSDSPGGARQRRYEVTITAWPGEESGVWEDVEDAEARRWGEDAPGIEGGKESVDNRQDTETKGEGGEPSSPTGGVSLVEGSTVQSEGEPKSENVGLVEFIAEPQAEASPMQDKAKEKQNESPELESQQDTCESNDKSESTITEIKEEWKEPEEEAVLVTNENREQYVKDYISWLTDRSIRRQYQAFEKGFLAVLDKKALSLFTPESLQSLVEGIQDIDIEGLEKTARYDDGYGPEHKTIRDFWCIVKSFSPERKRQLLEFVTASDRVPVNGIESIMFVLQRNGPDSERVPTSLTCFGRLLLPEYSSRKKLREKLKLALENGKGFGVP